MKAADAQDLAARHLRADLPRRWTHVAGVAARATEIAPALHDDGEVLVASAWLHDIGYSPDLVDRGFHPLDGARYLRSAGIDERIVALVAYHSCAHLEADERGMGDVLASEFTREESQTADALCYCDMTTSPDGDRVAVVARLDEIRARYGPGDVVTRFIDRAQPELVGAAARTEDLLARSGVVGYPM